MSTLTAGESTGGAERTPRLALWLAKKSELIEDDRARYDLVMAGWFEQDAVLSPDVPHVDIVTGDTGLDFAVPEGDARILLREDEP